MTHNETQDRLLDHDYDGILEYDNPMPGWWKGLFFVTFVFSLGYLLYFHLGGAGLSVAEEYQQEVRVHEEAMAKLAASMPEVTEEALVKMVAMPAMVNKGQQVFAARCLPCHGPNGGGTIGPNLTDNAWIHGGAMMDIYRTVTEGVLAKGMPAWKQQLSMEELRAVVAFVGTLRNTNVPGGKAPQGQSQSEEGGGGGGP